MNDKLNIIFLDVDGVLNSHKKLIEVYEKTHKPHSGYNYPFDEECLINLKYLVKETNSKLVITSTWRKDEEGRKKLLVKLKEYELDKEVIGFVPILNTNRGMEIDSYINSLNQDINFVILDDMKNIEKYADYLISTNPYFGLTKNDANQALKRLKKTK